MDLRFMILKVIGPQGSVCLHPGAKYMYNTEIFKDLLFWNRLANHSQTLCGALLGSGNEIFYKWPGSYDQDGQHGHK